jgi:hypothetical protein
VRIQVLAWLSRRNILGRSILGGLGSLRIRLRVGLCLRLCVARLGAFVIQAVSEAGRAAGFAAGVVAAGVPLLCVVWDVVVLAGCCAGDAAGAWPEPCDEGVLCWASSAAPEKVTGTAARETVRTKAEVRWRMGGSRRAAASPVQAQRSRLV